MNTASSLTRWHVRAIALALAVALIAAAVTLTDRRIEALPDADLCFTVADGGGGNGGNDLFTQVGRSTGTEVAIGTGTGTNNIEAIAFQPGQDRLFASNQDGTTGRFGEIDLVTGVFAQLGTHGSARGASGTIAISDVDSLSFDPFTGELWGVHRRGSGALDLLVQINPANGDIVENTFGAGIDYVAIQAVAGLTDIDDLAVSSWDRTMYAVANTAGGGDRLVIIDPATGNTTDVGTFGPTDMEGLGFGTDGQLLGTTGAGAALYDINVTTGAATNARALGAGSDYESVDCLVADANTITGTVYLDTNADASLDGGDTGTGNITVRLYRDADGDGTLSPGDGLIDTVDTAANGTYSFTFAAGGPFVLDIDTADLPAGSVMTTDNLEAADFGNTFGQVEPNNNFGYALAPADLSLTKVASAGTANVGDTVTFTITVTNGGPNPATNVEVTDVVPAGFTYAPGTIAGGDANSDAAAPTLTWDVASLAVSASAVLTFDAVVEAPTGTPSDHTNVAQVTRTDQADPDSAPANDDGDQSEDDEDGAAVRPLVADVRLSKAVDDATPNVGDTVTFTITVTNDGPDPATNVDVRDVIPGGFTYVASSIAGGDTRNDAAAPQLDWRVNTLAVGASSSLTFDAVVAAPTGTAGEHTNAAQVVGQVEYDGDSTPNNDDGDQSEDDEDNAVVTPQVADVRLEKTGAPADPQVGDTVTFTITVTNDGPFAATNVAVTDVLPAGYTYVPASMTGGDTRDDTGDPSFTWTISTLPVGAPSAETLTLQAQADAPTGGAGEYVNTAQVTAQDQFDPDSTPANDDGDQSEDDEANASIPPQISDVSLSKQVSDPTADVGDTVTFTITVANAGPADATAVAVTDVLPGGFTYTPGSIAGGDTRDDTAAPTLVWTINTLGVGAGNAVSLTFTATVDAPTGAAGEYVNTAQVTAQDQFDPDSTPNNDDGDQSEDDEDSAVVVPPVADVRIAKSVSDPTPNVGDTVTFTVTVTNDGPNSAANVEVSDVLPSGYTYVSGSIAGGDTRSDAAAPTLTWTITTLAVGGAGEVTLTFDATVDAPTGAAGEYLNTAQVTGQDTYDPDSTPNNDDGDQSEDDEANAAVAPQRADLRITKTIAPTDATPGDTVTFTIFVINDGPDAATNVEVTDTLPAGFTYVPASIAGGDSRDDSAAPVFTWMVNSLAVGTGNSVTLTFDAVVQLPTGAAGEYVNVAEVTAVDQFDPDSAPANDDGDQSEDDEDRASLSPEIVDLSLTKSVSDAAPAVGATVSFTVTVANAGPDVATGVEVTDVLPAGFSYVGGSIAGGDTRDESAAPTLVWTVASLGAGASVDLMFDAVVDAPTGAAGEYTNVAQVTAQDQFDVDSIPGNDDGDQSEDDEDAASVAPLIVDVSLSKVVSDAAPQVGDTVTFTVTVANAGPSVATNVEVTDVLPAGYTYVPGSIAGGDIRDESAAPTLVWTVSSLGVGAGNAVALTFDAVVDAPTGGAGEYVNVAEVTGSDLPDVDSAPANDDGDQSEDDEDSAVVDPQVVDVSLTKVVSDPSANAGDTVTFTITVANAGPDAATNVEVTDVLPGGYTYVPGSIAGGDARSDAAAPTLTWTIATLAVGGAGEVTLTFDATVDAPTGTPGEYVNVAQVTAQDQFDPDSAPNNDDGDQSEDDEDSAVVSPGQADVRIVKSVSDATANVGQTVTFTVVVTNDGPDVATNVEVTDVLPGGFSYVPASIAGGDTRSDAAAPTLTWTITTLAVGGAAEVTLTFDAVVDAPTGAAGEYLNVAQVTAQDQFDPDSTPNNDDGDQSEDDEANALVTPPQVDVSLAKSVSDPLANSGDTVSFTLTVANAGPDAASNVEVTDVVPVGFAYVPGSIAGGDTPDASGAPTLVWTVTSLPAGGSVDLTFDAVVNPPSGVVGEHLNVAQVTATDEWDVDSTPANDDGDQSEDDEDNAQVTPALVDLSLSKVVADPSPQVGDTVTFTLTVANAGPDTATNVEVTDVLPDGFSYEPGSIAGGDTRDESAAPTLTWTVASLAAGATVDLTFAATVDAPTGAVGEYVNVAQVTAHDQFDVDSTPNNDDGDQSEDDEDSATADPQVVDVSLTKAVSDPTPQVGDTVTFTVTVANAGPDTATGVEVTDVLPAGYTYVPASIAGGDTRDESTAPTLTWTVASLAAGAGVNLTFDATVDAPTGAAGEYVNVAQVTAQDQFDVDSAPNNDDGDQSEDDEDRATASPQVADVSLVMAVSDPGADVGDTVTFTITVTNDGPGGASGIEVTDYLPGGYTYVPGSIAGGDTRDESGDPVLTWTISSLAVGDSVVLTFDAVVDAPTGTPDEYVNVAEVTAMNEFDTDSTPANDDGDQSEDDEDSALVDPQIVDVSLTKAVSDPTANAGDIVTFTITLANAGPDAATNVEVTDALPAGFAYVAGSIAGGDTQDASGAPTLAWTATSVAAGGSVDLTFDALVIAPTGAPGEHLNVAQVTAHDGFDVDSTPANDDGDQSEDDEDNALVAPGVVDVSLTKLVSDSAPQVGDTVTFTITVANAGPDTATGIEVTDALPAGYTYVPGSIAGGDTRDESTAPTLVWTLANLAAGAGVDLTFDAAVDAPTGAPGEYVNVAEVTAQDQFDPDSSPANDDGDQSEDDEDSATVDPQVVDVSLTKAVSDAAPVPGDVVTFTMTVTNAGPDTATNVTVADSLPTGLEYVAGSASGGDSVDDSAAPTVTWTIASLPAAATVDLMLEAVVNHSTGATDEYVNVAEVTAHDQFDVDSAPNNDDGDQSEDDEDLATVTPGVIGIAKGVSSVTHNGDGTYTLAYLLTIENLGSVTIDNLVVTDDVVTQLAAINPTDFTATSGTLFASPAWDGTTATNIVTAGQALAPGEQGTVTISMTVTPGDDLGPHANQASVDGETPTGNPVTDDSTNGADPDADGDDSDGTVDGDGNPDEDDPTVVTFDENPLIGVAKAVTSGPTANGDGTHDLTYTIKVENMGDVRLSNVQIIENLATTFAAAEAFEVLSVTSDTLSVNPTFDGDTDTNLLAGTDRLAVGRSKTLDLTVRVTPGDELGPYRNSVTASGDSPGDTRVVDESQDGTDVDPDGNGDPTDNDDPTDVVFDPTVFDLVLTKVAIGSAGNGEVLSWRITVTNNGPGTARGPIVITDTLPTELRYTGFSGSAWTCAASGRIVTCSSPGDLAAGASRQLVIDTVIDAAPGARITNDATVTADNSDEEVTQVNNTDDASVTVDEPQLPRTGAELEIVALFGLLLLLGGGALLLLAHRRREQSSR